MMRVTILYLLVILGILLSQSANGQERRSLEQVLDDLPIDKEYILEELDQVLRKLYSTPVPINMATVDDLKRIPLLSDYQIREIIAFKKVHGPYQSLYELLLVDGINRSDWELISPFLRLDTLKKSSISFEHSSIALRYRLHSIYPYREGFLTYKREQFTTDNKYQSKLDSRFLGKNLSHLFQVRGNIGENISYAVTLEQDAGERFLKENRYLLYDFHSISLSLARPTNWIQDIKIGDYILKWGEGLLVWNGYTPSIALKSRMQLNRGLFAYRSSSESNFFRGAAIILEPYSNLCISFATDYQKLDGRLYKSDSTDTKIPRYTVSINESGYHRNRKEEATMNIVKHQMYASQVQYRSHSSVIGANFIFYNFEYPLFHASYLPNRDNLDTGIRRWGTSLFYQSVLGPISFQGEAAMDNNKELAFIGTLGFDRSKLALSLILRHYSEGYQMRYAASWARWSGVSNEQGATLLSTIRFHRNHTLQLELDIHRALSSRNNVADSTISGWCSLQYDWFLGDFKWMYRYRFRLYNFSLNNYSTKKELSQKIDIRGRYYFNESSYITLQGQYNHYQTTQTTISGTLLHASGVVNMKRVYFKGSFASAWCTGYNARLYYSEPSLKASYSQVMLHKPSLRSAIVLGVKYKRFALEGKLSGLYLLSDKEQSSGVTHIAHPYRVDGHLQLLYNW